MSTGDLVNRGVLVNNVDLLSTGGLAKRVGPLSACDPWSTSDPERCGGLVAGGAPGIEDVRQTAAAHQRESGLRMETFRCCTLGAGCSVGPERDPGTWPSGRDGASASAEPAAAKTETGRGPGRTVTAGSAAAAAAAPDAARQKMYEVSLLRS